MARCGWEQVAAGSWQSPCPQRHPARSDDVFEELCWEDGQLMYTCQPHKNQLHSSAATAPTQGTRDHGVAPLYGGGNTASPDNTVDAIVEDTKSRSRVCGSSLDIFDDDEMIAWLQYPPDVDLHVDKMYSKHPVVSYLPSLPLQENDGLPYRSCTLMAAVDKERHSMRNENSSQQDSLACTQATICTGPRIRSFGTFFQSPALACTANADSGSASDTQAPKPIGSPKVALPSAHFDPDTGAQNSLQSLSRVAPEWEPGAGIPSLQGIVNRDDRIYQQNAGACVSPESSIESAVAGMSLQGPNVLVDCHVAHRVNATSVNLQQMHEPAPIQKPDVTTCTNTLGALHSMRRRCADGADIKTFSKSKKTFTIGNSVKRKGKDSDDSESPNEDLANEAPQVFSTKRSRLAEIHNKSERKRRERINEKLKALQELIPNANKTDKASLLGEAIEYLKALQAQIMAMSHRTGIAIPAMLISHGMLQPYVPAHLGRGSGAGFVRNSNSKGVGGAVPTNSSMPKTSSLKPLMPLPALPVPARLVGVGNDLSSHVIGYNANYFPMVTAGLVSPPYQLQKHSMSIHHKPPYFL